MVVPRQNKSTRIRQKLTNSTNKRQTTRTNSKQKTSQTKRKKFTKRVDLTDPSTTNPITLRRSRRLTNKNQQLVHLPCEPTTNSNHITKIYPLRSRLRRTPSSNSTSSISTIVHRRSRSTKQTQQDLSSMGLRNGKIVNLRSILPDSTSQTAQEATTNTLPLLAFNPLPRQNHHHHPQLTNSLSSSSSSSSYSSLTSNNNNNNNNNEILSPVYQYHYSNITNHPSLDPTKYFPARLDILLDRPPVSREKQIEYGWNHDDRSMNIFVKHNDPCTFHRHVKTPPKNLCFFIDNLCFSVYFSPLHKVPMPFVAKKVLPTVFTFGKSNGNKKKTKI